jgi:hypothetical protein
LCLHSKGPAEQVEVVDVVTTHEHLQREKYVAQRKAIRLDLVTVDLVLDLRRAVVVVRENEAEFGSFARLGQELLQRLRKRLRVPTAAVLQDELESTRRAQAANRRRVQHERVRILDFSGEPPAERTQDLRTALAFLVAARSMA